MLRVLGLLVALQTATTAALAEEQGPQFDDTGKFSGTYLCREKASGGVRWDLEENRWIGTAFRTDPNDDIVLKINPAGFEKWESFGWELSATTYMAAVQTVGEDNGIPCWGERQGYQPPNLVGFGHILMTPTGYFRCGTEDFLSTYEFDLHTMRYIKMYRAGFIHGWDGPGDTPLIAIGACTRID